MSLPKYVRPKTAKGRTYYYFDVGRRQDGKRELIKLPDIKDPRFGGVLARAQATRTSKRNRQGTLTLDGLIRLYEKSPEFHKLAEATKRSYSRYLALANRMIRTKIGDSPPARGIEKSDVLKLRDELSDKKGAASQAVRVLGALYAWAVSNEKATINPAHKIALFDANEHQPWPEDLIEEGLGDPQVGMAIALFYFTGQRINEVAKMRWDDIKPDHMEVYVQKTKSDCKVAILPELRDMLDAQEKSATTILTNANGLPWTQSGLRQKLQAWAKARGHKVVPHGLRKNARISPSHTGLRPMSSAASFRSRIEGRNGRRTTRSGIGRAKPRFRLRSSPSGRADHVCRQLCICDRRWGDNEIAVCGVRARRERQHFTRYEGSVCWEPGNAGGGVPSHGRLFQRPHSQGGVPRSGRWRIIHSAPPPPTATIGAPQSLMRRAILCGLRWAIPQSATNYPIQWGPGLAAAVREIMLWA